MTTNSPLAHPPARLPLAVIPSIACANRERRPPGKSRWFRVLAVLCCSLNAAAAETFGNFTYTDSGTEITITSYPETATGAVEIPATIAGKPVTGIGPFAFDNRWRLTSVSVPASVTKFGECAFRSCTNLTSIPSPITSIGREAFARTCLTSVTFAGSLSTIADNAFQDCHGLTSVTIAPGVTEIGHSAFAGCTSLSSVIIPPGVSSIRTTAFHETNLTGVTIPASVSTIGNVPFNACRSLLAITVDPANASFSSLDGVLFNKSRTILLEYPCGKSGAYTIPDSVSTLEPSSFGVCVGLTSLTIPSSVTRIEDHTIYMCSALNNVTFKRSPWIAGNAFRDCPVLIWAAFVGNGYAPTMSDISFRDNAERFVFYFPAGASGYTTPVWKGFPAYPGQAPQLTSGPAPGSGQVGLPFSHTCAATAVPPAIFAVTAGSLPDGLSISSEGVISGTPTTPGTFTGTITASNGFLDDATQEFSIEVRDPWIFTSGGTHGTVTGGGSHGFNTTAILNATASPGYLFASWSGDASGTANPLSVLVNGDKTITAAFAPDIRDDDGDGLTNYQEIVEYGTDPAKQDTDGDGAKDAVDGRPLDPLETLDTDRDGIGDNADTDDDGDGYLDDDEINIHHTDPKRADSDGDGLNDPAELETHHTNPNIADTDSDGLRDGEEFTTHHTNLLVGDTDGDGFLDGYEVLTGKSPLDIADKPALVAEARTAIEFTFPSAIGKTYRIEDAPDLTNWTPLESGIAGTGGQIQRFYSTRNSAKRYFRVEEVTQ